MKQKFQYSDGTVVEYDEYPKPAGSYCWLCAYHRVHTQDQHDGEVSPKPGTVRGPSLGAQLWEECDRCSAEPSYARPNGHLCARCIGGGEDHPRIPGPAVPTNSREPDGAA